MGAAPSIDPRSVLITSRPCHTRGLVVVIRRNARHPWKIRQFIQQSIVQRTEASRQSIVFVTAKHFCIFFLNQMRTLLFHVIFFSFFASFSFNLNQKIFSQYVKYIPLVPFVEVACRIDINTSD